VKAASSFVFVIGFVGILLWGVPVVGPVAAPWFSTILAVVFVSLFLAVSRGKPSVAFSVIAFFTVIFPLALLMFIGWGTYPSVWAQTKVIGSTLFNYGQLRGFEMFLPLLGSWLVAKLVLQRLALTHHSSGTPNGAP
jgi:hypothetical protein